MLDGSIAQKLNLPIFLPGEVWLVGAGPGDPGLLTIHALNAIAQADIILYDALVDLTCLCFAKSDAILQFAGKRGGKPSLSQEEITNDLVKFAQNGKRVLRLKGGDPFVFGRGGEEALALKQASIVFRIIPGITAGIAGPAYAGIPITSRNTNQSVTFITGHDANGRLPDNLDWPAIAKGSQVIVFYMALKHFAAIVDALLKGGRDRNEQLAFISNATTQRQKVVITSLEQSVEKMMQEKISAPAIIILGPVVEFASLLDWMS
ncbi:uroporphyrinogen-III C-methyltransferase [Bartonella sp. HY329]|uniref:uroporphyrinogen-III C-methyltransferase n=1 Tax=unclassified Bartonella TaxID=2645622 RepID=UPI0021C76F11|nr:MULTISPECIES: uroporphyrinogen-III C-methyltransferase [unclassified Bartonella]UXM94063.1 uroporphyrinogen-III C-methyltransferase [Bartonella sp. HY329]UXN08385.1 uroporphyrinogen-III C-methyltransferase [Bartonella sp. HY328]